MGVREVHAWIGKCIICICNACVLWMYARPFWAVIIGCRVCVTPVTKIRISYLCL